MKNIRMFIYLYFSFFVVKFSVYLNRLVFVMALHFLSSTSSCVLSPLFLRETKQNNSQELMYRKICVLKFEVHILPVDVCKIDG